LEFAEAVSNYARSNGARVLVGTQITCDEAADDRDWSHVLTMLRLLGPDHVLGLAVGNELDQLHMKEGVTLDCVNTLWSGRLLKKVVSRMDDVRALDGFQHLPITSVFTADVVWNTGLTPFKDTDTVRVNTFLTQVVALEPTWVFTLNFYPYFDPNNLLDPDGLHCKKALANCKCFDKETCLNLVGIIQARKAITRLTGNASRSLWVGEVGWSAPMASTLDTAVRACKEFSGHKMLYDYYSNFLAWDLSIAQSKPWMGLVGPEIAFYFTLRDSANFGHEEYFGLIGKCHDKTCKLNKANTAAELLADATPTTRRWASIAGGFPSV